MKNKDIILILISVFTLIVAWVIFNLYHNSATSTISKTLIMSTSPIKPSFDTKTISELKKRQVVIPLYQLENQSIPPNPSLSSSSSFFKQNNPPQASQGGAKL